MNKKNSILLLDLTQGAMIAALYVVLTFIANLAGLASGVIQVRLSEALTILPVFTAAAVPGLAVGCVLANLLTGCAIWDVVFGSLATLIGAVGTRLLRKKKSGTGGFAADPLQHYHCTAGFAASLWSGGRLLVSGDDGRRGRNHLLRGLRAAALPLPKKHGNLP